MGGSRLIAVLESSAVVSAEIAKRDDGNQPSAQLQVLERRVLSLRGSPTRNGSIPYVVHVIFDPPIRILEPSDDAEFEGEF